MDHDAAAFRDEDELLPACQFCASRTFRGMLIWNFEDNLAIAASGLLSASGLSFDLSIDQKNVR